MFYSHTINTTALWIFSVNSSQPVLVGWGLTADSMDLLDIFVSTLAVVQI